MFHILAMEVKLVRTDKKKVELIPAFTWTCPDCGTDHFTRAIVAEMSPEELQELRERLDVEPWEEGHLLTNPKVVTCPDCQQEFDCDPYNVECDEDF